VQRGKHVDGLGGPLQQLDVALELVEVGYLLQPGQRCLFLSYFISGTGLTTNLAPAFLVSATRRAAASVRRNATTWSLSA
jgi:hypothetical protein